MTSGVLLAIVSACCYAAGNVCLARVRSRSGSVIVPVTLAWNVVLLGAAVVAQRGIDMGLSGIPLEALLLFGAVGLLGSWLGRWGLFFTISRIGASRASTIKNCAPIFSVPLGLLLFDQVPSARGIVGIVLIVLAVWLLSRDREHAERPGDPSAKSRSHRTYLHGMAMGLVVAMIFGASDSVRLLGLRSWRDPLVAAWCGSVVAFVVGLGWILARGGRRASLVAMARTATNGWVIGAGAATSLAMLTNFAAVAQLYVGYVTALLALAPVATLLIGRVVSPGSETLGRYGRRGMVVVLVGTILVVLGR